MANIPRNYFSPVPYPKVSPLKTPFVTVVDGGETRPESSNHP
jgi:hypothetical protein